jgi:hypothetical protein
MNYQRTQVSVAGATFGTRIIPESQSGQWGDSDRDSVSFVQEIPKTIERKKISHRKHLNEILYDVYFPLSSSEQAIA